MYVKEFKKSMRVVSMNNVSAVPYNGFYGCYGYAPAVARSLRDVTTSLHLIKEELRRRETTTADGPPRRETCQHKMYESRVVTDEVEDSRKLTNKLYEN
jgi:hypothetical protein